MNTPLSPQAGAQQSAAAKSYTPTWIKVCCDLPDKAEVLRMAHELDVPRTRIIGGLVRVWAWFNRHSIDGTSRLLTFGDVDAIAELEGFAQSMFDVGWLARDTKTISLPNFDRHSFQTEKARLAKGAERSRRHRAKKALSSGNASRHNSVTSREPSPRVGEPSPSSAREENSSLYAARQSSPGAAESIANIRQLLNGQIELTVGTETSTVRAGSPPQEEV